MFDISTVPYIGVKEFNNNGLRIYKKNNEFFLEHNSQIWMTFNTTTNWQIKEFTASYNLAHGNVLVTGLGFGIQSMWIASKPTVKKVTVIERVPEIVEAFLASNTKPDNMEIIIADANSYKTDEHFNFMALDHYENEPWPKILESARTISKNIPNHNASWIWSFEKHYADSLYPEFDLYRKNVMHGIKIPHVSQSFLDDAIHFYFDNTVSENRLVSF